MVRYILCIAFLICSIAQPYAQSIAWIDGGQEIVISDLEAGTQKTIVSSHSAWAITSHPVSGDLYWTDSRKKAIYVTKLADKSTFLFIDGLEDPGGITIDDKGKIYVLDDGIVLRYSETGAFEKTITDDQIEPLDVYYYDNRIYFGDGVDSTISSIDLEGNNKERITGTLEYLPVSVKINELSKEIFWVGGHWGIFRTELDGSGEIEWIYETDWPCIAIDKASNLLYYSNTMNLGIMDLNTLARSEYSDYLPSRMVFNDHDSKLYLTNYQPSEVIVSIDNEKEEEVLFSSPGYNFYSLDIDHESSRLFWAGRNGIKGTPNEKVAFYSSDLEGAGIMLIHEFDVDRYSLLEELKINQSSHRIYWSRDKKIFSSEFDGTDVQEVFSERTGFISFDYNERKMYCSRILESTILNRDTAVIVKTDFDGSNAEEIFKIEPYFDGVFWRYGAPSDLYVSDEKIYWLDERGTRVNSIGKDGQDRELLLFTGEGAHPLSLDFHDDRLYYVLANGRDEGVNSISLDGSDNTLVLSGNVYDMVILPDYFLSTEAKLLEASLFIYPNPTMNLVNLKSDQSITLIELMNLSGEVIKKVGPTNSVDLLSLPPNIYILRIKLENGENVIQKIIKL